MDALSSIGIQWEKQNSIAVTLLHSSIMFPCQTPGTTKIQLFIVLSGKKKYVIEVNMMNVAFLYQRATLFRVIQKTKKKNNDSMVLNEDRKNQKWNVLSWRRFSFSIQFKKLKVNINSISHRFRFLIFFSCTFDIKGLVLLLM